MGKTKKKDNTCEEKKPQPLSASNPNNSSGDAKTQKSKKRRKGGKKHSINAAKLPSGKQDYSANWKQLLQTIKADRSPSNKKESFRKPVFKPAAAAKTEKPEKEEKKPEIWFDDVDPDLLDPEDRPGGAVPKAEMTSGGGNATSALVKEQSFQGLTRAVGIDCEMVGVGWKGEESILARVSIVNHFGHCVYDKYVKPREKVTDYRTRVSGIRPADVANGEDFQVVQKEVSDIFNGRILIGHSIKNDLKVLFLTHPKRMIRDTSVYRPFRALFGGKTPSLKRLSARLLGVTVQEGEHSSVQDAQATMRLYTMYKRDWEREILANSQRRATTSGGQQHKPTIAPPAQKASLGGKPEYVDSD